jgi:hypothetical protein
MKRSILVQMALLGALAAVPAFAQAGTSSAALTDFQYPSGDTATAPMPSAPITGKQASVTLKSTTEFGKTVLKPGTYYVEHEIRGSGHVFTFWQAGDPNLALQYSDESLIGQPVSVPCQLEALSGRVKHTKLTMVPDGALSRVVKIEIKGEDVAHTFQR